MELTQRLYDHFKERAKDVKVEQLTVGLSYSAVTTSDGGIGIAYTYASDGHCCRMNKNYTDYEGRPAIELLEEIESPAPLRRTMGLALVNALNYREALGYPEDPTDSGWMDAFGIGQGSHVAMVGFFRPLLHLFEKRGAEVEALDDLQGVGERESFYEKLGDWADALLVTSTSILNDTTEDILGRTAPGVKVVMIGPSTPMVPKAFSHLPVHILAGTIPVNKDAVLKAVRHGAGTPVIHRFSRKAYVAL